MSDVTDRLRTTRRQLMRVRITIEHTLDSDCDDWRKDPVFDRVSDVVFDELDDPIMSAERLDG